MKDKERIEELERENEAMRNKLSRIQDSMKVKTRGDPLVIIE